MKNHLIWGMSLICFLCVHGCARVNRIIDASAGAGAMAERKPKTTVDVEGDKSALEIRSIQLKEIDGEYKMTFRSVMDVLQDMGFTINDTNMETGHISAIKKIPVTTAMRGLFSSTQKQKSFIPQEASITMEEWGKGKSRVRVNTDLGKTEGSAMRLSESDKATYLQPEKFYEEFFAKLGKAVFLRQEKL